MGVGKAARARPYACSMSVGLRRIGGALSQFWAGGSGPSHAQIQSALMIAGYQGAIEGSKQSLVQAATSSSDDSTARLVIEELLSLLREGGYFESAYQAEQIDRLRRAVEAEGYHLTDDGFLRWGAEGAATTVPAEPAAVSQHSTPLADEGLVAPNLTLLVASLRRLGTGATRPLVRRRRSGRPGLRFDDEYDVQDAVEAMLRCLYSDVRCEEPTPSSAGSSSRMDLHLREGRTAVEVKVTGPARGARAIKPEVLVDINDYRNHPTVDTLVVAVYDLADKIENPAGFEHDLSERHGSLDVRVIVIPWVGPLSAD